MTVQDVEVVATTPDIAGEVEPQTKLPVLAPAAAFQALNGETLHLTCFRQARPAVGDELNVMAAASQFAGQGERLQSRAAVLRVEVGGVHQYPGGSPFRVGCAAHSPVIFQCWPMVATKVELCDE